MRGVIWFGLVMAPIYADHLAAIGERLRPAGSEVGRRAGRLAINQVFLAILLIGAVISLPWVRPLLPMPGVKSSIISLDTRWQRHSTCCPPGRRGCSSMRWYLVAT